MAPAERSERSFVTLHSEPIYEVLNSIFTLNDSFRAIFFQSVKIE